MLYAYYALLESDCKVLSLPYTLVTLAMKSSFDAERTSVNINVCSHIRRELSPAEVSEHSSENNVGLISYFPLFNFSTAMVDSFVTVLFSWFQTFICNVFSNCQVKRNNFIF